MSVLPNNKVGRVVIPTLAVATLLALPSLSTIHKAEASSRPTLRSLAGKIRTQLTSGPARPGRAGSPLPSGGGPASTGEQPNVLLVLVDDLDSYSQLDGPEGLFPKSYKLFRERGMELTQSFGPGICCASRSSLFTGKYPFNTGVLTNAGLFGGWAAFYRYGNESATIATMLQSSGYNTAIHGKYLNEFEPKNTEAMGLGANYVPPGWSDFLVRSGEGLQAYFDYNYTVNDNGIEDSYGSECQDHYTEVISERAKQFIEGSVRGGRPFFELLAPTAIHLPSQGNCENRHLIDRAPPFRPRPNYLEGGGSVHDRFQDKPVWLRRSKRSRIKRCRHFNGVDHRNRFASARALDDNVAEVIEKIDQLGQRDNTYIIFTSDNGYNNCSHGLLHKMAPYEESQRVPLFIAGPGIRPGSTSEEMAHTVDLYPTIAEMAGAGASEDRDGISLLKALTDPAYSPVRHFFPSVYLGGHSAGDVITGHLGIDQELKTAWETYLPNLPAIAKISVGINEIPSYRMIRTRRYKYIEWYDDRKPFISSQDSRGGGSNTTLRRLIRPDVVELYNLKSDPYELENLLAERPAPLRYRAIARALKSLLHDQVHCSGVSCHPGEEKTPGTITNSQPMRRK